MQHISLCVNILISLKKLFSQCLYSLFFVHYGSFNENFTIHLETILTLAVFSVICYILCVYHNTLCITFFSGGHHSSNVKKVHSNGLSSLFLILQSIILLWLIMCNRYFHFPHSSSCLNKLYRSSPTTFDKLQKGHSRP